MRTVWFHNKISNIMSSKTLNFILTYQTVIMHFHHVPIMVEDCLCLQYRYNKYLIYDRTVATYYRCYHHRRRILKSILGVWWPFSCNIIWRYNMKIVWIFIIADCLIAKDLLDIQKTLIFKTRLDIPMSQKISSEHLFNCNTSSTSF